ncbi:MAG: thiol:disulfide interchange protein DsbA/DsbL [Chromatiales bacterium]|jgi:thiol:disulfide interchange protein DsbA|nr:thiol:disulfide interchange protein DsbA/DsbL [Chromatiales bacterium]
MSTKQYSFGMALLVWSLLWMGSVMAAPPESSAVPDLKSQGIIAGVNYRELSEPQPTDAAPGTVEVVEFFWYNCQTCFVIEPALARWLDSQQGKVTFRRVPAVVGTHMVYFARAYYAAEALGIEDSVHLPIYEALHRYGRALDREEELAAFFTEHGVDHKHFLSVFRSSTVAAGVRSAQVLARTYEIAGAPSFIIAGKYRVDPTMAANASALLQTVAALVEQEQRNAR